MKSLRRSFNNANGSSSGSGFPNGTGPTSPPVPIPQSAPLPGPGGSHARMLGKPSDKVAPPQKVIKALVSKRSGNPQELSYVKGDFWYVTGEREGWFEALNPLTGSRGLVPRSDFEEFAKGGRQAGRPPSGGASRSQTPSQGHLSMTSNPRSPPTGMVTPPEARKPAYQPLYAIVQFDFQAERPDELDAKQGDPIMIIAQSNHEWFVAKPIGRLGGPGLIPVTFVQIRDVNTGKPMDTVPDNIPLVEEWKKATADYKAASIPLGHFDFGGDAAGGQGQGVQNSPYTSAAQATGRSASAMSSHRAQGSVSVNGNGNGPAANGHGSSPSAAELYKPEHDPLLPPGDLTHLGVVSFHNESGNYWFRVQVTFVPDSPTSPAYSLSLYRTYEDFYDFQISLLDTFPAEAGRAANEGEEEPPRILPFMPGPVDDEVDDELTEYRRDELDSYVKLLVELKEQGKGYVPRHELFRGFFAAKYGDYCEKVPRPEREGVETLNESMGGLSVGHGQQQGAGYGGHSRQQSRNNSPLPPLDTSRPGSGAGYDSHSNSRAPSGPGHARAPSSQGHGYGGYGTTQSSAGPPPGSGSGSAYHNPQSSASLLPNSAGPHTAASTGTTGTSGGAGQPPYVKIKVYDRSTDDLIALRVHPNITHADLFEKVRSRLGTEVTSLRYRVGMGSGVGAGPGQGGYREIKGDRELGEWMREDGKLVLYAEQ